MEIRRIASTLAVVLGALMIVGGGATALMVRSELATQNIVTPDDACLPGNEVKGPFTAWCQAQVIDRHARDATGGLTFAELARDDPRRASAMNASFLRASLFTSIVAYGVAAMAAAMGVLLILIGLGMRDVERHVAGRAAELATSRRPRA
jgi:hypothetical protein